MYNQKIVVDANIFVKMFVVEHDSQMAREFLSFCNKYRIQFIAPTLFEYEVIGVCMQRKVDLNKLLGGLNIYYQTSLTLQKPTLDDWRLASKICQDGNEKSGCPSMYDSIYQAMAINHNICFITADSRHFAKTSKHGNIVLLENWQSLFNEN